MVKNLLEYEYHHNIAIALLLLCGGKTGNTHKLTFRQLLVHVIVNSSESLATEILSSQIHVS